MLVKFYRVISILSCKKKFVKKVVAKKLSQFCETNIKLYTSQMEVGKSRRVIDIVAIIVNWIHYI